jgi:hypothetical protein
VKLSRIVLTPERSRRHQLAYPKARDSNTPQRAGWNHMRFRKLLRPVKVYRPAIDD